MNRAAWLLLGAALVIRLIFGLSQDHQAPFAYRVGDSWWYLANGDALVSGRVAPGIGIDVSRLPTPPGYVLLTGIAQAIVPDTGAVILLRIVQAVVNTAMIACCGWIAFRLTGRRAAAALTVGLLAVSPALVIETAQITSETLFMALLAGAIAAYIEAVGRRETRWLLIAGIALGLAALTRSQILLFAVGLAVHLALFWRAPGRWRAMALLLTVYVLTVGTWTAYNLARWQRFVFGGEGFAAFIYIGATGWDSPEAVDERLGSTEGGATPETFIAQAGSTISADPIGYIGYRLSELTGAVLQPHNTAYFPGESLRELALTWARDDRTLAGLIALTGGDAFWPKLTLYLFQYIGAIAAAIGIGRARHNPRVLLVLIGLIAYILLLHLVLLATPRYIFPTVIALAPLAAAAVFPPRLSVPDERIAS